MSRRITTDVVLEYLCRAINAGTRNVDNIRFLSITFLLKGMFGKFLLIQVYILLFFVSRSESTFPCQSIRGMEDEGNDSLFIYSLHVSSSFSGND